MKRKRVFSLGSLIVLLALVAGLGNAAGLSTGLAQEPQAQPAGAVQAQVGTGFTYQGQLKNAGGPVNGTCDLQFGLWDGAGSGSPPTGGTQVGTTQTLPAVTVTGGLFAVVLNGGNQFGSSAFTGEARWLQIAVRCPAGGGSYATLSPRQALTAVPYALSLMPNATLNGLNNAGNLSFGSTTRQMLDLYGTQYGIGVQSADTYFRTDSGAGFAWYLGGSHSDSHYDPGFLGGTLMTLDSSNGLAVWGKVSATANGASPEAAVSGSNTSGYGVYGQSDGGSGVYGQSVSGNGVAGASSGPGAGAVLGVNTGGGMGVSGVSNVTTPDANAIGVYGESFIYNGEFSVGVGVMGKGGTGVSGSGTVTGVKGTGETGVEGYGSYSFGVRGETQSASKAGVYGYSAAGLGVRGASATFNGVQGESGGSGTSGVYGENSGGGFGVAGRANGDNAAVLGDNTSTGGMGVAGMASGLGAIGVWGHVANCAGGQDCYGVWSSGNFAVAPGFTKSAIVRTADYGERQLYTVESPQNWFEDFGLGRLVDGRAVVQIEPIFAQTVNLEQEYHVFLTPRDGYANLYVTNLTPVSFEVRDADGKANLSFSYRIVAKRSGLEDIRLSPVDSTRARTTPAALPESDR